MRYFSRRFRLTAISVLAALSLSYTGANAGTVSFFFEDFETGVDSAFTSVPDPGRVGTEGFGAHGFGGFFLRNTTAGDPAESTVLTLAGLPTHTSIDLNFLLAIIDSWDGRATTYGTDLFNVTVDGQTVFSNNFNTFKSSVQDYEPPTGVAIAERVQHGFREKYVDSAYDMGLDPVFDAIAHSASTLTIEFFASGWGWQGNADENWAIDNVEVLLNGVPDLPTSFTFQASALAIPEPGTLALVSTGLLGLTACRRPSEKRARLTPA